MPCAKFKSNLLAMEFLSPLDAASAARNALVPRILRQGCEGYPTLTRITERLQSLYNVSLGGYRVIKHGEVQIIGQTAWMLDQSLVPDGTDVLGGTLDLLSQIWFSPLTENGAFMPAYTESEKKSLADAIRAKINNKNSYAPMRCYQEMCRGERYGVPETGALSDVEAASPESVYGAYRDLLAQNQREVRRPLAGAYKQQTAKRA